MVINIVKKSKTLREVKPVKSLRKNLPSFLEISPVEKEVIFHINCKAMHISNRIFLDLTKITLTEKFQESIESSKFVSNTAIMSGEFDSRKDSYPTKLERRPQIFVKLSSRELGGSKLPGFHPFDNMGIIN